jgi:hypothetical protein
MTEEETSSVRTGNYVVEFSDGPSVVYKLEPESGHKDWVCTCPDPDSAMIVVEGLILVENKRFYYPDSGPTVKFDAKQVDITVPNPLKAED